MPRTVRKRASSPSVVDKSVFAREIAEIMRERDLTQTEASFIVREPPSQLSLIVNGKLRGFSPERLIQILNRFGRDVEIRIGKSRGQSGKVRVLA